MKPEYRADSTQRWERGAAEIRTATNLPERHTQGDTDRALQKAGTRRWGRESV